MGHVPGSIKSPLSLRSLRQAPKEGSAAAALGFAALIASNVGMAFAQDASTTLPPVKVDAPREKPRPAAPAKPKPAPAAIARTRPAQHAAQTHASAGQRQSGPSSANAASAGGQGGGASSVPIFAAAADADRYADPAAPYRAVRLSSEKFTQPILNTPRTVTVLTKEVLEDKNATTLREIGRSTAGVTLGTGEGGNAFGDRFFIRGFDARNDIFVDGIRDPGVSIRENFYTEQVEILRGPGSTFAGRGTAGGAVNIVTKQATDRDFTDFNFMGGFSDATKRVTLDANRVISPILAVRLNAMYQDADVAGRNYVVDDRNGVAGSVVFKPIDGLTLTAEYNHVYLNGLPDFGVPYNRIANRPFTENLVPRNTWYGFLDRDYQKSEQDFGTFAAEYKVSDNLTFSNKFRQGRSVLDYIGTLAEGANLFNATVNLNPQSRNQTTSVLDNQTEAVVKFKTGPVDNAVVTGVEFSREQLTRDTYAGLQSELNSAGSNPSIVGNLYLPPTYMPFGQAYLTGNPTRIAVDTASGYVIETADYQNTVIANGGVRYDDYTITSRNETYSTFAANHSGMVNYNAGLTLKPLPNVSLYAAYATSSNPVGAELDGSAANYGGLSAAAQIFAPQYNRAKEIGVKWLLFDHLLATAALFRTDVSNAREVNAGVTTGNAAYYVQGLDVELAGNITDKWSATGGLVLMQSKVTQSYAPTNVGLQLANVAHQSFSLLSKYKFGDLFGLAPDVLEFGGQAIYRSKVYGGNNLVANGGTSFNAWGLPAPTAANPFVNVPTELPSYWRFDVFTEAKIGPYTTLKLSVQNLFNRTYYDAFYQSAAPFAQMAPGRAVYLEARVKF
ncbi:TonB-dependent receptor [Methylocystis heyeri]|uniref:TonB-dependent receptor plug domain-containing protein n=1 Tax=Methylocystis heyeri TaxID=391905 RepID=A0A6B8KI98_9HYPH|nr:TonB-dependent receptor plug domain-containing protein [Methylocystis heyeri]